MQILERPRRLIPNHCRARARRNYGGIGFGRNQRRRGCGGILHIRCDGVPARRPGMGLSSSRRPCLAGTYVRSRENILTRSLLRTLCFAKTLNLSDPIRFGRTAACSGLRSIGDGSPPGRSAGPICRRERFRFGFRWLRARRRLCIPRPRLPVPCSHSRQHGLPLRPESSRAGCDSRSVCGGLGRPQAGQGRARQGFRTPAPRHCAAFRHLPPGQPGSPGCLDFKPDGSCHAMEQCRTRAKETASRLEECQRWEAMVPIPERFQSP